MPNSFVLNDKIPQSRSDLVKNYCEIANISNTSVFQDLEPSQCAMTRDPVVYNNFPFSPIGQGTHLRIGNRSLEWVDREVDHKVWHAIGLENFRQKKACNKRIQFIEENLQRLASHFPEELNFICEFTSKLIWFDSENNALGSAGFYEIPHCTFFSDISMFSIPPNIIVPREAAAYAIFENLYHEALHHQMHAAFAFSRQPYLQQPNQNMPMITIDWRDDRDFTLLEAIHALHVYRYATPCRWKYLQNFCLDDQKKADMWAVEAFDTGFKMWTELSAALISFIDILNPIWSELIMEWSQALQAFNSDIHGVYNYDRCA